MAENDELCSTRFLNIPFTPRRIKQSACSEFAEKERWIGYCYTYDLTPLPDDDDPGNVAGAWSFWDLPVRACAQFDDERGNEKLLVAISNRWYVLDWTRFRDEWNWDSFDRVHRTLTLGPLPSSRGDTDAPKTGEYYTPQYLSRFRELHFALRDVPSSSPAVSPSAYRITVADAGLPTRERSGLRDLAQRNRASVALIAPAFYVTLEHEADEQFSITWWAAIYDSLGRPIKDNDPRQS